MRTIHQDINDEELLGHYCKSGKPEHLALLYQRYVPMVYGVTLKYLNNTDDARNAVMQIFGLLLVKTPEAGIREFEGWLYDFVKDWCLQGLRDRPGGFAIKPDENLPEYGNALKTDVSFLSKCIETLPEKQRICVYRFFIEERSYDEIAEATGFSVKQVRSLIQQGKVRLKVCFESKGIN